MEKCCSSANFLQFLIEFISFDASYLLHNLARKTLALSSLILVSPLYVATSTLNRLLFKVTCVINLAVILLLVLGFIFGLICCSPLFHTPIFIGFKTPLLSLTLPPQTHPLRNCIALIMNTRNLLKIPY